MENLNNIKSLMVESDNGVFRIRYRTLNGKMCRMAPGMHPRFESKEEAKVWITSKQAFIAGEKARRQQIKENAKKYSLLNDKINLYIESKKKETGEWKTIDSYFRIYLIPFFGKRGMDTPEMWPTAYRDFLAYLDKVNSVSTKKPLKQETKRKICFWINNFLLWLYNNGHSESIIRPITVPEVEDNELNISEAYWFKDDLEAVKPFLQIDYFNLLVFGTETAMRISEILSMRNEVYRKGDIPDKSLHDLLAKGGIEYTGYIKLTSQIDKNNGLKYSLAPLKGKSAILDKHARYIPCSPKIYEIVKYYYNKIYQKGKLLPESTEELFWPDISISDFNLALKDALKKAGLNIKTSHSMRHTGATNFLKKTGSELLTKMITGHESDKAFKRYNHLITSIRDRENKIVGPLE